MLFITVVVLKTVHSQDISTVFVLGFTDVDLVQDPVPQSANPFCMQFASTVYVSSVPF